MFSSLRVAEYLQCMVFLYCGGGGGGKSFTPIKNDSQNYIFKYFNIYVFRQSPGRQKIQNRVLERVSQIVTARNFFIDAVLIDNVNDLGYNRL
jgi:hypothetical protein